MHPESGFLSAIIDHPEEDVHRLVWADWLEDQGRPEQATFVRAQVALARLDEADRNSDALLDTADDLLARHETVWLGDLAPLVLEPRWHRGCLEHVALTADRLLRDGDELFASAPIRSLRLLLNEGDVSALRECRHLRRIERLDVSVGPIPGVSGRWGQFHRDRVWQQLFDAPVWQRLTELHLSGQGVEGPLIRTLADTGLLARLRRLDLTANHAFGPSGCRALLLAGAPCLEELNLLGTNLVAGNLETLLGAKTLPALRRLDCNLGVLARPVSRISDLLTLLVDRQLTSWSFYETPLKTNTLQSLLESPQLANLTQLTLNNCRLAEAEIKALAECPQLTGLRYLNLGCNRLTDRSIIALAESPYLSGLTRLYLEGNAIGGPGIRALLNSPTLAGLRELDLSGNFLGTSACQALADSVQPRRLHSLTLRLGNIEAEGVRVLMASPALSRLRSLDLSENRLGDSGVLALKSPPLGRLQRMLLDNNDINLQGAQALLDGKLPRLRQVSLRQANLTQEIREQLATRFQVTL